MRPGRRRAVRAEDAGNIRRPPRDLAATHPAGQLLHVHQYVQPPHHIDAYCVRTSERGSERGLRTRGARRPRVRARGETAVACRARAGSRTWPLGQGPCAWVRPAAAGRKRSTACGGRERGGARAPPRGRTRSARRDASTDALMRTATARRGASRPPLRPSRTRQACEHRKHRQRGARRARGARSPPHRQAWALRARERVGGTRARRGRRLRLRGRSDPRPSTPHPRHGGRRRPAD